MNLQEFKNVFREECDKNSILYDEKKSEQLFQCMKLVLDWNLKINVTRISNEFEFVVKHYVDCLSISKLVFGAHRILDIGTGAGFPGIPLKIYNPEVDIFLLDSVNKKITVVNDIIEKLNLKNAVAMHVRAEELARDSEYRETFDIVTTRAVSNLSTISELMLPFLTIGGKAICMKGPNVEQELEESKKAIEVLGGEIESIDKIVIDGEYERNNIIIRKVRKTDNKYPRGQGKPAKEPIK